MNSLELLAQTCDGPSGLLRTRTTLMASVPRHLGAAAQATLEGHAAHGAHGDHAARRDGQSQRFIGLQDQRQRFAQRQRERTHKQPTCLRLPIAA